MDVSGLKSLGEIAGIGGIAIGAMILLVRPLIEKAGAVPAPQRAPLLRLIALGAFTIGVLGIAAWLIGDRAGLSASTSGTESPAIVSSGNVSVGAPIPVPAATPAAPPTLPTSASASTRGAQSPAIISGGDVAVSPPSAAPLPQPQRTPP